VVSGADIGGTQSYYRSAHKQDNETFHHTPP